MKKEMFEFFVFQEEEHRTKLKKIAKELILYPKNEDRILAKYNLLNPSLEDIKYIEREIRNAKT